MNSFKSRFVFGQYWNKPGITMFMSTLLKSRRSFIPHVRAHNVASIDFKKLHGQGIRYVVFDKDNTLTAPYERHYFSCQIEKAVLQDCKEAFGEHFMAVLSNSAGSRDDKDFVEADAVEKSLGIKVIRHKGKKPAVQDDIMHHFQAREEHLVAVIGDRILSDIVMGNSFGMFTIYVDPLNVQHENFVVRFVRLFENKVVPLLTPKDKEPMKHPTVKEYDEICKSKV